MSASELVKTWKAKAAQKAAERAALIPVIDVVFAGFPGKAKRAEMEAYVRAGKAPQYFTAAMFAAVQGKPTEMRDEDATPQQKAEWVRFQSIIFCDMMVEPKFSRQEDREREGRALAEDELDYATFMMDAPEVLQEAIQWQLDGCPTLPIQTETGVMSFDELATFRDGGGWLTSVESFYSAEGEYWDTKPTARVV